MKFLNIKKQKLNEQLYKLHLKCPSYWDKAWHHIRNHIEKKIQQEMENTTTQRTKQHSRTGGHNDTGPETACAAEKLLMMDTMVSETCRAE